MDQRLLDDAQPEVMALVDHLLGFAVSLLAKSGNFLPYGAVLDVDAGVRLIMVDIGQEIASSVQVIPPLHDALRRSSTTATQAVGTCEWVTITPEDGASVEAAKILVEHYNGVVVAVYVPLPQGPLGEREPGEMIMLDAQADQCRSYAFDPAGYRGLPGSRLTGEEVIPLPAWVPRALGWLLFALGVVGVVLVLGYSLPFALEVVRDAIDSLEYVAAAMAFLMPLVLAVAMLYLGWRLLRGLSMFPSRTRDE